MSQVITNAFETYWQGCLTDQSPVVLDEVVLADIPDLDITAPINPDTGLPAPGYIVHRHPVDQRGRVNNNAVAYTIVMDTTVGDFSFNAMYLINKATGIVGMIVFKGREEKVKTDASTNTTGNSMVKSMLMEYDRAADATMTNVAAGTWQIDYSARLNGMEEEQRQHALQLFGHHSFIDDGFQLIEQSGIYKVMPGKAIVGGLYLHLEKAQTVYPGAKPIGVWVDAFRAGTLLSAWENRFSLVTSVSDLNDYQDQSGYLHSVAKIATIGADGSIKDHRRKETHSHQWADMREVPDDIGKLKEQLNENTGADQVRTSTGKTVEDMLFKGGLPFGNDGVKYALSAAAFRRDKAVAGDWFVISDTAHIPVNSRGIEGGVNPKIKYLGKRIGALILSPDETLAMDGVSVGGSVGYDYALMSIGAPCSFSVDLATGEFDFDTHYFDKVRFKLVISAQGVVTLTHPSMRLMREAIVRYVAPSSTDKNLQIHYQQTPTPGMTSLFLLGDVEGTISYNGTEWVVASSDQWDTRDLKFTWDEENGVLLVEHQLLVGSPTLTVTMLDLGANVYTAASQAGSNSFKVKFRKHDGSIPSLSTALGFYFYRGESGIRKQPKGKLMIHLGQVQVNCEHFNHPQGNVWSLGLMEN